MNDKLLEALEKAREEQIEDSLDSNIVGCTMHKLVHEPLLQFCHFPTITKHPTKAKDRIKFFARGENQMGYGWVDATIDIKQAGEMFHRTFDLRFYRIDYTTIPATIKCFEHRIIKEKVMMNPSALALAA